MQNIDLINKKLNLKKKLSYLHFQLLKKLIKINAKINLFKLNILELNFIMIL